MTITLQNTLTRKKETFTPLNPNTIGMYVCGPTVYDRAHIGNARAVVVFDVLYRVLQHEYPKVMYVRNITDVDDKINARAQDTGRKISDITAETTRMFHEDMAELGCLLPTHEPRATQHIPEMIAMIERLIANGNAYAVQGHVLFSVETDSNYGHLARRSRKEMVAGARVEVAPYKKDPGDFVLWKPSAGDEPGWDSPWGYGRPGWHIECSAMSTKYLGTDFDIHGGGADLQFPHHENEIAQSCCANKDSHYARYWVHNGFLTVGGEKMSKSLGNFITVNQALGGIEHNCSGQIIRTVLLMTHYRKPLDWNDKAVEDAIKTLDYLYKALKESVELGEVGKGEMPAAVIEALRDDLNTPKALAELYALAKELHHTEDTQQRVQLGNALVAGGKLLGLFHCVVDGKLHYIPSDEWFKVADETPEVQAQIEKIVAAVKEARQNKNWAESDRLRDEAKALGYTLEYKPGGEVLARRG